MQGGGGPHVGQADPEGGYLEKLLSSALRRVCIEHVRQRFTVSERRMCAALSQHRMTLRGRDDGDQLTNDIVELARR